MQFIQRIPLLLFDPDYATSDLYDSPRLGEAFFMVSTYAVLTSFNSFFSGYLKTDTVSVGLIAFLGSALLIYLTWVFLAAVFHIASEVLGGLGEFPHALGFVGLAAAPHILTSFASIILTILSIEVFYDDPELILPKIGLGLSLLAMAWGWPGVLCYFGMKNAERVHPLKALVVTLLVFFAFAALEVFTSDAL
ncbi:MAG: YIP1 family protein [Ignavibacteria bacterium]|nr:YIP1 family protein [Ignavibacteria bacterium]